MATIEISGIVHAYELTRPTSGSDAPTLVFIHGWLLSRHYWRPLVERLADSYPCLLYDLRGFGDSQPSLGAAPFPQPEQLFTLAAYARDLQQLLEQLQIERAWLVGHSLGGSIALWGAAVCPQRVTGVLCLNAGGGIYVKDQFERFRNVGRQLVKRRPHWLPYIPLLDLLFTRVMVARPLSRYWGRQRLFDLVRADEKAALGALLDSTTEAEVHLLPQVVSQLKQPVYFLAGTQDKVMEPKYVSHLASFHPLFGCCGNNVIELSDCGHMSMLEQPDRVAAIVGDLIDGSTIKENL